METNEKEKRRANWTKDELDVMVTQAKKFSDILNNKGKTAQISKTKAKAWLEITNAVNTVSHNNRTKGEVKKKFANYKSDIKLKIAQSRREFRKRVVVKMNQNR